MNLAYAFFADAADTLAGRLNVQGGELETIEAARLPVSVSNLALVMKVTVPPDDLDAPHTVQVFVRNPAGERAAVSAQQAVRARRNVHDPNWLASTTVIVPIAMNFALAGRYDFDVVGDDRPIGQTSLFVASKSASEMIQNAPAGDREDPWQQLEADAMSNAQLREIAEYLRNSGQASA